MIELSTRACCQINVLQLSLIIVDVKSSRGLCSLVSCASGDVSLRRRSSTSARVRENYIAVSDSAGD